MNKKIGLLLVLLVFGVCIYTFPMLAAGQTALAPKAPTATAPSAIAPTGGHTATLPTEANIEDEHAEETQVSSGANIYEFVKDKARTEAGKSYRNPERKIPEKLLSLSIDEWNQIRFKPEHRIWRKQGLNMEADPYHLGFIFDRPVRLNLVEDGKSNRFLFSPTLFNYGSGIPVDKIKDLPKYFAGLKLFFASSIHRQKENLLSFIGASYFRGRSAKSIFGISARGLALNTALPSGEELPYFKEFWLCKPARGEGSFTIYALLDSPSLTGAYRFITTPGTATVMEVESSLYLRKGSTIPQKLGIAPMGAMFQYAEGSNGNPTDYRPEVHSADGLLIQTAENNWLWRPLTNPPRLSVQTFPMQNPKGFALMQRDNNFDHYQDLQRRPDIYSSLWVEPLGNWGEGHVELVELPTKDDIHNNIAAFWVPKGANATPAGDTGATTSQQGPVEGTTNELHFAYKLYWMDSGVTPHLLGKAVSTRMTRSSSANSTEEQATFYIDFESEELKSLPADTGLTSVIELPKQASLVEKHIAKNPVTGGWRLTFSVSLPKQDGVMQTLLSAREGVPRFMFSALLKKGENLPAPLTETWVYHLAPQGN